MLNALRHQRSCHASVLRSHSRFHRSVLNALRHQRSCHNERAFAWSGHLCAQRLAASTKLSLPGSTRPPPASAVLNALRHQRSCHVKVNTDTSMATPMCSTPCGINEVVTLQRRNAQHGGHVLNALRHQRSCHEQHPANDTGRHQVLNALRHQRSCHGKGRNLWRLERWMCSTPCGINEVVTRAVVERSRSLQLVLNALRHQRSCHPNPLFPTT